MGNGFSQVVQEACELLRKEASRRGTLNLSSEVLAMLESIAGPDAFEPGLEEERSGVTGGGGAVGRPATTTPPAITAADVEGGDLEALAEEVRVCRKCSLCEGRTQTVFGSGNPKADLVFVGEAPGEHEDLQGKPFVGRAGQLLTDIIVKGMKLRREDVYICNVLKCRPPENRDPLPTEKLECEPYLVRQLALIRPKVICALGAHAATTLLKTNLSMGRLRGAWHFFHGIPLRATYHPAYLLYEPNEKVKTWADVQEVMKVLSGESIPKRSAASIVVGDEPELV